MCWEIYTNFVGVVDAETATSLFSLNHAFSEASRPINGRGGPSSLCAILPSHTFPKNKNNNKKYIGYLYKKNNFLLLRKRIAFTCHIKSLFLVQIISVFRAFILSSPVFFSFFSPSEYDTLPYISAIDIVYMPYVKMSVSFNNRFHLSPSVPVNLSCSRSVKAQNCRHTLSKRLNVLYLTKNNIFVYISLNF